MVNHEVTRVQFDKLQQSLPYSIERLLQCLRFLSFGIPRYGSEWQREAISRRIQLTLVKHHRLYSTACRIGSTSWTFKSTRRVLGVFFVTRRSRNKHDFHNRSQEEAHAPVGEDFYFAEGSAPCFFSRFEIPPSFSLHQTMCFFPIFFGYFPREKSSSPDRNLQDSRPYVLYRLFRFRPNYDFLYPGHSFFSLSSFRLISAPS